MARIIVNVPEAKARLAELVDMVCQGETVTIAKNGRPLADLVPHRAEGRRRLGIARGRIRVSEDFTAECEEINGMFYGDGRRS